MRVGVLALQGAFRRHREVIETLGVESAEIRTPAQLDDVDRLIIPGGESTTMSFMLENNHLFDPLAKRLTDGMPVFGTCAGMIMLATDVLDGRDDQRFFGAIDIAVRRNAFGRQVDSFETDLTVEGMDTPFHAVFIRAPIVETPGPDVQVLASVDDQPVLCQQGSTLVAAFHPELTEDDTRLHELFLNI